MLRRQVDDRLLRATVGVFNPSLKLFENLLRTESLSGTRRARDDY